MKKINQYLTIILLSLSTLSYSYFAYSEQNNKIDNTSINHTQQNHHININTASAEELAHGLNGIGLNKAKKIIEYREKFGPFVTIEQLKEVSGIGQSILDKNAGKISL